MKINPVIFIFFVTSFMPTLTMGTPIDQWTFETSQPTTAGPVVPETGSGTGTAYHSDNSTAYTSTTGNGSADAWNATRWNVNDYWQFSVSTLGEKNIALTWDQASSNTGPGVFGLFYSTDGGSTFTQYGTDYTVLANATPNPTWSTTTSRLQYSFSYDLSLLTDLNNDANVYFQLRDMNTTSANSGTVGTGGTDRIDNFTVSGTDISNVPDSPPGFVGVFCLLGLLAVSRRISHVSSPSLVKITRRTVSIPKR